MKLKMKFKKVLKIGYYVVVVFIALVAILLIVSIFPIPGNYRVMVVQSGSMEPTIKMGSIVVVKPQKNYKIGDIITFTSYNKKKAPITHRIYDMEVVGGYPVYITKGDANNAPDTRKITKKDIVGKVIFSIPYVGYAVDFARKPIGFIFIVIVPAAIIIFDETKKIYEEIKKKKNK